MAVGGERTARDPVAGRQPRRHPRPGARDPAAEVRLLRRPPGRRDLDGGDRDRPGFGRFALGYGRIGPTEIRIVLIALNTALALGLGLDFNLVDIDLTVFDLIGLAIAAVMIVLLAGRAAHNLRLLAKQEPAVPRH